MRKVFNFLKNLKSRQWFWALFICFLVVQFAMFPRMLTTHYIYAEDGGVFINQFQEYGVGSFFKPFAGYLVTLSRIFAAISVTLARVMGNFAYVCESLEVLGAVFVAFVLAYFASDRFEFLIKKRSRRLIVGLLVSMMVSCFTGMLFGGVGIHWWCGLLMFLISLEIINDRIPPVYMYPFIVICVLTSPSALLLGFGLAFYLIKKIFVDKKWKEMLNAKTIVFLAISIISLAIQAFVILFAKDPNAREEAITVRRMLGAGYRSYELMAGSSLFPFTLTVFNAAFLNHIGAIVGGAVWIVVLYLAKKKKVLKEVLFALVCIAFLYFMVFFKRSTSEFTVLTETWYGIFYNALPAALSMIMIPTVLLKYEKKQHLIIALSALVIIVPHLYIERWRPLYGSIDDGKLAEINKHLDTSSDTYAKYVYGEQWFETMYVPVEKDFCNEEWIECETF